MRETFVCYYGKYAYKQINIPGIFFLKNYRNVCFFDEEQKIFLSSTLNPIDINGKTIIPIGYIGIEQDFFDAIRTNGGLIPCGLENNSAIVHWPEFYEPKRKIQIIKGRELIDPFVLEYIEATYGLEIFFKTLEKSYSDKVTVDNLRNDRTLIYNALKLHPGDEFIISEYVDLIEDEIGTKEYRVFVYNNQILNISRNTQMILHSIDENIFIKALEIVEKLKGKAFPSAYVLDLGEYIDKNGQVQIDVIEFNDFVTSGHYLYNSVDFLPCDDMLHEDINNIAIEFRPLIAFCQKPNERYKNLLTASKYYHVPESFAFDLMQINDFRKIVGEAINPGKIVDEYIEWYNKNNKKLPPPKVDVIQEMRLQVLKELEIERKESFIEYIKQNTFPIRAGFLYDHALPDEPAKQTVNPEELVINQDTIKQLLKENPELEGLKKLIKTKTPH